MTNQFMMGNQILARAALEAGAKMMFGYPITPSSEILETWAKLALDHPEISYLQSEDEMAAGFAMIGSCFAGVPAFTATAGPGNVLMQDAFSMAEALRIPTVAMIVQRGGLSTSTVIYSQEEVRLTCFGGNGEGFRVVYSTANLQELYDYTLKAFQVAWQYRYPTFILADGYQGKMMGKVNLNQEPRTKNQELFAPILKKDTNLRNCYNLEEEIGEIINQYAKDYSKLRCQIEEYEDDYLEGAEIVALAHGIVASAAKEAVEELRSEGLKIGLFRPVTLRPFPRRPLELLRGAKKIVVFESALGQLAELFRNDFYLNNVPIIEVNKPAEGFTPQEIADEIRNLNH